MLKRLCLVLSVLAAPLAAQDRPVVAAVNYPLAWMAERLGGDAVEVLFAVPEDRDPGLWRPGLAEIAAIQQADLIALNGAGFAAWVTKASLPRSRVVDTSAAFRGALIATESLTHSHGGDGEHSHTGTASYTWLDPMQAAAQAAALAAAMERRLPEIADTVTANLPGLVKDLSRLDAALREALAPLKGTTVLTTHPRYQYLARAYGFQTEALEWDAGAAPDDAQWLALADLQRKTGASVLVWEARPPTAALTRAREMGLRPIVFPPLANRPASGDFLSAMQDTLSALADG